MPYCPRGQPRELTAHELTQPAGAAPADGRLSFVDAVIEPIAPCNRGQAANSSRRPSASRTGSRRCRSSLLGSFFDWTNNSVTKLPVKPELTEALR